MDLYRCKKQYEKFKLSTKNEAYLAGMQAYDEYINGGNNKESQMSYADYLDYWMKEYFEINYKYSTAKRYSEAFETIKKEIGKYKLCALTPYILNQALLKLYQKSGMKESLKNYLKVLHGHSEPVNELVSLNKDEKNIISLIMEVNIKL